MRIAVLALLVATLSSSCTRTAGVEFVDYCKQKGNKLKINYNPDVCVCIGERLSENYDTTQKKVLSGYLDLLKSGQLTDQEAVAKKAKAMDLQAADYNKRLGQVASAIGFHFLACSE